MKVSYWLYLSILIFAPLAFGTVELWSLVTVEVLAGTAAVFFLSSICFFRKELYSVPGGVPLLLLLFFILLQLIPLPVNLVRTISPATYNAYAPILSISEGQWIPLTINQKATLQEFFRISCYSLIYFLTINLLSIDGRLKKTVYTVIALAAGIAMLAIVQQVDSPDRIFWLRTVPDNSSPFGPWINPNQFAGYMEMMAPLALGLFLFYRPRMHPDETLRGKIVNFFTMPGSSRYLFLGCAATLMALSVFVSLCRGGILTIILSVFVFMLMHNMKQNKQGRAAVLVIVGCVVMAVSWFGWDTIAAEFNHGFSSSGELNDGRFPLWADTLRIIQSFFLFGSGFGTYIDIFPSFRSFPGYHVFDHAHNDYLELLTDGGVIGFVLAAWFVLAVLGHGWKLIRARRDLYAVLLGIGAFTGIIAMLMHSVTDFNMHNGADGLYFFFLCGLLVAVVNIRFEYCDSRTLLQKQSGRRNGSYLAGTLLLTVLLVTVQYGVLRARTEFSRVKDIYVSRQLNAGRLLELKDGITMATRFDPLEYLYSYKLGSIESFFGNRERSLQHLLQAARLRPMDGNTLQGIGFLVQDTSKAEMLLEKGYQRNLDDDELAVTFVEYLLQKGERDKAVAVFGKILQKTPALLQKWAPLLEEISFSREEIAEILPHSVDSWIGYGVLLEKANKPVEAEYYFSTALSMIPDEEEIKPQWFQTVIRFYIRNGQPEQALLLLRQAVEAMPDYADFHIQLGDYYKKEGITFRAKEEYERALIVDPGNRSARKRLRLMGVGDAY